MARKVTHAIRVDDEVYALLLRIKAELELRTGRPQSFSAALEEALRREGEED